MNVCLPFSHTGGPTNAAMESDNCVEAAEEIFCALIIIIIIIIIYSIKSATVM
jgi:hypothetical protein